MKKHANKSAGCLICGKSPQQARGLCATHHTRFHRQMRRLDSAQKELFEQTLIDRGLLLPPKSPGRQVDVDPFRDVAVELFVAETAESFDQIASSDAKPGKSASTKASSRNPSTKKKTKSPKKKK